MAKIDWDYAAKADRWTLEEFKEFLHPNDPSAQAKLDLLVRRATGAWKQVVRRDVRFLGGTPEWKKYIIYVTPAGALAWAQGKGFIIPPELAGMASPHPADETQPSTTIAPDNEPVAKRKAPDIFVAALFRLIAEIGKRAAGKGMLFDVTAMPGTKADFRALAIEFDGRLIKAPSTFNDYLAGLLRFKEGARETNFYRDLFPELFT